MFSFFQVSHFHGRIQKLVAQGQTCQKDILDLQTANQNLKKDIVDLEDKLTHIERNWFDLGDSINWPRTGGRHSIQRTVTFVKPYPKPPVVYLSAARVWFSPDDNGFYHLQLVSVSTSGFVMKVHGGSPGDRLHGFSVDWISFPQ